MVLGGRPDGCVAALWAEQLGVHAVLIEEERIGGVRPDVSGIPTMALPPSAEVDRVFHVLCKRVPNSREREGC